MSASGSSSKRKDRSHDKETSKSREQSIDSNTTLALNGLIDNIVLLVRESGYTLYLDNSEVRIGKYLFNIEAPQKLPSKPIIVSSVSIVLHGETILLKTPRTRSRRRRRADTFYIEEVFTHKDHRCQGWATLLLIYALSYLLKLKYPNVKIFTLSDESTQCDDLKYNIYNRLGFIYMYPESMNLNKRNKTIVTFQKKILDFNTESIHNWVTVRCLGLINDIRAKSGMFPIAIGGNQKRRKQTIKQTIKQTRKQSRKQRRKQ